VRSASGDDGRKLFQCGAQRARIQGPRCNEPVRQSTSTSRLLITECTLFDYLLSTLGHILGAPVELWSIYFVSESRCEHNICGKNTTAALKHI
jgi:hypothetical protein